MNLTVGYIPYLNMVPFHERFGPDSFQEPDVAYQFRQVSPRQLGLDAETGLIDAGAMSLVDMFRLSNRYEPLGDFGVGVKRAAGSVLLFSKVSLGELRGMCAVTDETSTSVRLLQVLLERRYSNTSVNYGRVAPSLYDGSADALLLIGDEALRARRDGIKGLPVVTDLATEWYAWQGTPFVFARWVVRKELPDNIKIQLQRHLERSLGSSVLDKRQLAEREAQKRGFTPGDVESYWGGFLFRLTPEHGQAMTTFNQLVETVCLTV